MSREADVHLNAAVDKEACPLNLAPTASTTAALALGDALAVALLDARGFSADDFARTHPGGSLGRRLLIHVRDVMHTGKELPQIDHEASLKTALLEMTEKGLGMTAVVDPAGKVAGVFTDGDLRRALEHALDLQQARVTDLMTPKQSAQTHSPWQQWKKWKHLKSMVCWSWMKTIPWWARSTCTTF
jgi:arabinose-5-phosphate isomerase